MSARYDRKRVRQGLIHFLVGKGVSSTAGFCAMLVVVRLLPIEAFAVYSVLIALVELFTAVSGVGLTHALLRYVPELYGGHYHVALRQFLLGTLSLRSIILLTSALIAYLFSDALAELLGISGMQQALNAFLLVVVLRSTGNFLSQVLESTLHQGKAQVGYSLSSLIRLTGMFYLLAQGQGGLTQVILVEAMSEAVRTLVTLAAVLRIASGADSGQAPIPADDATWLKTHLQQIVKFAISGYTQHLVVLPFGSNMNRLVCGQMFNSWIVANFGFAQSLYEYCKRYLPAQLLAGLIRPVLVARYSTGRDFAAAAWLCEGVFQVNLVILGLAFTGMAGAGEEILSLISGGKYGKEALVVLAWLLLALLLETRRLLLEILVQAVERYAIMIPSNILLALSILPAIAFAPRLGAIAFPIANCIGLLIANSWVRYRLSLSGMTYSNHRGPQIRITASALLAIAIALLMKRLGLDWPFALAASVACYSIAAWQLVGGELRAFYLELARTSPGATPGVAAGPVQSPRPQSLL